MICDLQTPFFFPWSNASTQRSNATHHAQKWDRRKDAAQGTCRLRERCAKGRNKAHHAQGHNKEHRSAPWYDRPGSWTQTLRRCSLSTLFMLSMNVVGMSLRSGHMRKLCCWQEIDLWAADAKP